MSSIGGIKGGGGGKKAGGAKGAGGAGPVRKGGGATFGKIDRVERIPLRRRALYLVCGRRP